MVTALFAGAALVYLRQPESPYPNVADALWMVQFLVSVSTMAWLTSWVRRLEEDRTMLLASEREARTQAEAANAAKDEFLAVVSHEMKTPLMAILAWAELVRRNDASAVDRARAAETIARSAQLQAKLIDELLDAAGTAAGKFVISLDDIDASDIVRQVIRSYEPRTREAKIELMSVVADSGTGIESAHLERVFERFWQGTRLGRSSGLGLGLAIVRHIVDAHGGHVWAESLGVGRGTTFIVELPLTLPTRSGSSGRRQLLGSAGGNDTLSSRRQHVADADTLSGRRPTGNT